MPDRTRPAPTLFARHPDKIIPNQDQFLDGWDLPEELRFVWLKRRELFLDILKNCEQQEGSSAGSPIADMMNQRCAGPSRAQCEPVLPLKLDGPGTEPGSV
jgi:hypothetical protein